MTRTDVVIGGGGMVGMTLAIALARAGLDVVVADPLAPSAMLDAMFDGRVSAPSASNIRTEAKLSADRKSTV